MLRQRVSMGSTLHKDLWKSFLQHVEPIRCLSRE